MNLLATLIIGQLFLQNFKQYQLSLMQIFHNDYSNIVKPHPPIMHSVSSHRTLLHHAWMDDIIS